VLRRCCGTWSSRAGLPDPQCHQQIDIGRPINSTYPDCFWEVEEEPGVCLYLDGLSGHTHGNPVTREIDRAIGDELRSRNYEIIVITATQLHESPPCSEEASRPTEKSSARAAWNTS
jgi:hypothetical protein